MTSSARARHSVSCSDSAPVQCLRGLVLAPMCPQTPLVQVMLSSLQPPSIANKYPSPYSLSGNTKNKHTPGNSAPQHHQPPPAPRSEDPRAHMCTCRYGQGARHVVDPLYCYNRGGPSTPSPPPQASTNNASSSRAKPQSPAGTTKRRRITANDLMFQSWIGEQD